MLTWGILGLGKIADTRVAPAFRAAAGNELVAVAGRDSERTAAFAARHHARPMTVDDLLADPAIQAVYIAATNELHEPYTVAAARAGKHVLCEKPLSRTPQEAAGMIAACAEAGVQLGTAFMMRYHPAHRQIHDLVRQGALGTLHQVRVQFAFYLAAERQTWRLDERLGGGPLLDVGSHAVDLIAWLTGQRIGAVGAVMGMQTFVDRTAEDAAILNLVLEGGMLGQVNVAFNTPFALTSLELHGSAGSIRTAGTLGQVAEGHAELRTAAGRRLLQWQPGDLYAAEIMAFADAVAGTAPLDITGEAGLVNLRVLAAATRSATNGGMLVAVVN